ncbi:MAG: hypothetical protein QOH46_1995 [Solirubrobacteraceae bacterium]|jgi:hypothetical protein|nr:hypothetical protein [Solirubrobacteraceae bacterium]
MTARAHRLDEAFDRIEDFLAVQGPALSTDAVARLQEAVGVDADARAVIAARVAALQPEGHGTTAGSVLLGVLVALFAADAQL